MKEFNLEEAKAGKPVCTRDGRNVRIITFDIKNDEYPIVAAVDCRGKEVATDYTINGKYNISGTYSYSDLMMVTEKKKGWINLYKCSSDKNRAVTSSYAYESEEVAKSYITNDKYIGTFPIEWEE